MQTRGSRALGHVEFTTLEAAHKALKMNDRDLWVMLSDLICPMKGAHALHVAEEKAIHSKRSGPRFPESMECVSPILNLATSLWDCTANCVSHIRDLKQNVEILRRLMERLNLRSEDVKSRLELEQREQMIPLREVQGWLCDIGDLKNEVDAILQEADLLLEKQYCLGSCHELPLGHTVGLDSVSQRVCSCFKEDEVGIVGLYGVRGVGKTTLLKKINNDCLLQFSYVFDIVVWVALSNQASVTAAQEVIANKLRINEIGVPLPDAKNGSKVIITTRSLKICSEMEAQRRFKIECLPSTEALNLFMLMVREDTLSSHPDIRNLAYSVMERCKGLPLALVTVGRALADKNTLGNGNKRYRNWRTSY
ncbi:putative disease resistance protein [Vitis vinifera]|uniref:Putative disease resistance protein n=1 Tax=Vitis vinifera TaxID=29760 RepID=A0A438CZS2_VITVI|nr:putative disease resistance protein [Vitis vinifera]